MLTFFMNITHKFHKKILANKIQPYMTDWHFGTKSKVNLLLGKPNNVNYYINQTNC